MYGLDFWTERCTFVDQFIQLLNSLHASRLLELQTAEKDVWINEPLIPSSEVTTRKPASDFDQLIV